MAREQFMRIGRDAFDQFAMEGRHEMIAALALDLRGDRPALVEILPAVTSSPPNASIAAFFSANCLPAPRSPPQCRCASRPPPPIGRDYRASR